MHDGRGWVGEKRRGGGGVDDRILVVFGSVLSWEVCLLQGGVLRK